VSLAYREVYQKVNNAPTTDAFSAYSFDAWLVFLDAAKRALAKAQPGTPQFREAFRDAMLSVKEIVGTHGVYNFNASSSFGVDDRARVLVQLQKGAWLLIP
jgi:branched-chain amino acid transport system substrate-binding protein